MQQRKWYAGGVGGVGCGGDILPYKQIERNEHNYDCTDDKMKA